MFSIHREAYPTIPQRAGNRSVRKSIHSLRQRILEHQQKIESEQAKSLPNQGLIAH